MNATIEAGNRYIVTMSQAPGIGSTWVVRTYKKILFLKRRVSSDWFLDKDQADRFVKQLVSDLKGNGSSSAVEERKPGWTLHRPQH